MSKKQTARGVPDETSLAYLLEEFQDVLGMELYPEAIDELPTERAAWPVDLTIRTGPPQGMTKQRETTAARKRAKKEAPPPPEPAALPPPRGFKGSLQDLIQTKVTRPQARPEPAQAFLADVPTDRFVPLRRSPDSAVIPVIPVPQPGKPSGGLDLEYFQALDSRPAGTAPAPPHPLVTQAGPHGWGASLLSLFLGVSVGLALALIASAVLLLLARS